MFAATFPVHDAAANLVQNGDFSSLTSTWTPPTGQTTLYGQFGTRTGSTITVANWTTSGYNFVYAPGTADAGTQANGANAGAPKQAPGQYNGPDGTGNTYMWGPNNGSANGLPATSPSGGNFIAADGDTTIRGAIQQTVGGLQLGKTYTLSFWWAAAQQQAFTGNTTEQWQVSLGSQNFNTRTINLPSKGFSGWEQASFTFTYLGTTTSNTLSFLANGTPNGQPPFLLLDGVSLELTPEFSNWMIFAGFGVVCTVLEVARRRQRPASAVGTPAPAVA